DDRDESWVHVDACQNKDDEGNGSARYASSAYAPKDCKVRHHQLLSKRQIHPRELREKQYRYAFVKCGAILIRSCADGQYETADLARHAEIFFRNAQRRRQRGRR